MYKRRLSLPYDRAVSCVSGEKTWPTSQIGQELAYAVQYYNDLEPQMFISYERDSYREIGSHCLRITFDTNILYRRQEFSLSSDPWGDPILPHGKILMELKTTCALPLWIVRTLSDNGIFKTSFSKYGTAYQKMLMAQQEGVKFYA